MWKTVTLRHILDALSHSAWAGIGVVVSILGILVAVIVSNGGPPQPVVTPENENENSPSIEVPQIEALATSQSEVQIDKDQTLVIQITGGKLPLTSTWIGIQQPGSEEVEARLVARRLVVSGKSKLQKDKSYQLRVRDSRAAPEHITIKFKTPKT